MKKYEKLLRKLSGNSRRIVIAAMRRLRTGDVVGLNVRRLRENYFRCRAGGYRIFFHFENGVIEIDDVKKRDEDTYRGV